MAQELPIQSWKRIRPWVVSASKSGAVSPIFIGFFPFSLLVGKYSFQIHQPKSTTLQTGNCPELSELKNERDDSLHPLAIGCVLIGEFFAHHFFFGVRFDLEACEREDEHDHTRDVSVFHPRRDEHGE